MSNKFSVGTLVMMKAPENFIRKDNAPPNGAIGEVMDGSKYSSRIEIGSVVCDFPRHPSGKTTDWWAVPTSFLIPLSDPDLDVTTEEDEFDKKYEEEYSQ